MSYIFLNLKRFDIPTQLGGVNSLAKIEDWAKLIVGETAKPLSAYENTEFVQFFPEAHIIGAVAARKENKNVEIGCQGLYWKDSGENGFGAFTSSLSANAAAAMGCGWAIIGHCEERNKLREVINESGGNSDAVNRLLNREIICARKAGLKVLYCIGETEAQLSQREQVLREQLETGLANVSDSGIVIGYEPVWAIGPGKTPPDGENIRNTAIYIKSVRSLPVVYGGGLKADNAAEIASIPEVDGGLIALTQFSGQIGFYPQQYLEIINIYHANRKEN